MRHRGNTLRRTTRYCKARQRTSMRGSARRCVARQDTARLPQDTEHRVQDSTEHRAHGRTEHVAQGSTERGARDCTEHKAQVRSSAASRAHEIVVSQSRLSQQLSRLPIYIAQSQGSSVFHCVADGREQNPPQPMQLSAILGHVVVQWHAGANVLPICLELGLTGVKLCSCEVVSGSWSGSLGSPPIERPFV